MASPSGSALIRPLPIRPLSIGNVVNLGLALYRSHLKTYAQISLTAHLWLLVPIYGWAKYMALSALLSRLAFGELTGQPESGSEARQAIKPKFWSFFRIFVEVGSRLMGVAIALLIALSIFITFLGIAIGSIIDTSPSAASPGLGILLGLLVIAIFLAYLYGLVWFFSRWILAEVILAIETDRNGRQSISRSWVLTQRSVIRIQMIATVTFLVTLPLITLTSYLPQILLLGLETNSLPYRLIYFTSLGTGILGSIVILPFWQTTKAVLYCDLRSRREGFGLKLQPRPQDQIIGAGHDDTIANAPMQDSSGEFDSQPLRPEPFRPE